LVVRDALGRESVVTRSYYAASQLLRKNLHDYSYEVGFLRRNFGSSSNSYGPLAASMTHRYGFSNAVTGELHVEATARKQVIGFAADMLQPGLGLFNLSVATSRNGGKTGSLVGLGLERQTGGFSLGARAELTSKGYTNLGLAEDRSAASKTAQAFIGAPTGFGSIGASYLLRAGRGEPDAQILSANASFRLGFFGSLQVTAQHTLSGKKNTILGFSLTRSLGSRRSASTSFETGSRAGRGSATVQQSVPMGEGFGYRASMSRGFSGRMDAWAGYQGRAGFYEAELTRAGGQTGIRLGTSGTLGFMGGAGFAARRMGDSFAQVRVDGVEGVRVYANNQLIGTTNKAGILLVPQLEAYEANRIKIDPADVPIDFELSEIERQVRPHFRSGVVVRFGGGRLAGGLIKVVLEDGSVLPAGAVIRAVESEEQFVVAPGGEAYVTGLSSSNRLEASWGEKKCHFSLPYKPAGQPQPSLGTFKCTKTSEFAAKTERPTGSAQ
jgi:outer membrane usher protein